MLIIITLVATRLFKCWRYAAGKPIMVGPNSGAYLV